MTSPPSPAGSNHFLANQIGLVHARRSGLGVCVFLEAALGMESGRMGEAARLLGLSEAGARKAAADAKKLRLGAGLEWEIPNADADVLLGLTHALS
ncbi:hypothetical protein C8R44DRAFT_810832, partial [Mycena epipterygia]